MTTTPSPHPRLAYYLERVGITSLEALEFEQRKKVFLLATKDFMDEVIDLDILCNIGADLWKNPSDVQGKDEVELNSALYACSELSFYVRRFPDMFVSFMTEVKSYFEKYFPF